MKNMILRYYRLAKGLSQQEVADAVGACADYINMIENNKRTPGLALAKRIADFFGTTIDKLFFCKEIEQSLQNEDEIYNTIRKSGRKKNAQKILEQYNLNV